MKSLYTVVFLLVLSQKMFCQCPPSTLKIQMPLCDSPTNLNASIIDCSKLQVSWKGNKDQLYIVEATYAAPEIGDRTEKITKNVSCDNNGNCNTVFPVKEGIKVDWNVQSKCTIVDATFYSYKIEGKIVSIPYCTAITNNIKTDYATNKTILVYPNPTYGILNIEYNGKISGALEFSIIDITGKRVFNKVENGTGNTNKSYQLDVHGITAGTYLLEIKNGQEISVTKIVLYNS